MTRDHDFEKAWLAKLSSRLDDVAGQEIRREVMAASEDLSDRSGRQDVINWSIRAMDRLDSLVGEEARRRIMTGCACRYPPEALEAIRLRYEETGDVGVAHQMLQDRFETLLRDGLHLDDDLVADVVGRGWGAAGIWRGGEIIATKIPKSGYLVDYMHEKDPERRRQLYCHCPRVRDVLNSSASLSPTYCYCGAGYYQSIWEEILQQPVEVELLASVLKGDEVCSFAIRLPAGL
jgi:hypothetical protein